jgi:hypothetical protein
MFIKVSGVNARIDSERTLPFFWTEIITVPMASSLPSSTTNMLCGPIVMSCSRILTRSTLVGSLFLAVAEAVTEGARCATMQSDAQPRSTDSRKSPAPSAAIKLRPLSADSVEKLQILRTANFR